MFLFSKKIYAFGNFIKFNQNPLVFDNSIIKDNQRIAPFIHYENGIYHLWYRSLDSQQIAYAISNDGLSWQVKKLYQLYPNNTNGNPSLLKIGSDIKLFFSVNFNPNISIYQVNLNNSYEVIDGSLRLVIEKSDLWWEKTSVADPFVFYKNNKYYLFYTGYTNEFWRLGLAISKDGINWSKCPEPILDKTIGGAGPELIEINNKLYLFYHHPLSAGIFYTYTNDQNLSCQTNWQPPQNILLPDSSYDKNHLTSPTLLKLGNKLKLYYSGLGEKWTINLAEAEINPQFSPIIILPGLMASWNKEAILHNQPVNFDQWTIPRFITEYNGLINSLKNLDYQENIDFFVFPYDWRQPIEKTTNDLYQFLENKIWSNNPSKKVNLIGHSLGGLIARIFSQKNQEKVNQLITVGSPHQGTVQVYPPLAGGEINRENSFLWLAEKLILILNKSTIETDRVTIQKNFPVAFDLWPTFDFLKKSDGNFIPIKQLTIQNQLLNNYNQSFSLIFPQLITIYGEKDSQTPAGYIVNPPNLIDKTLNNYPDGRPISIFYDLGDYTVLTKSAKQDTDHEKLDLDHGEIITDQSAIKKIFNLINIDYQDEKIIPGKKTIISPSLIFLIRSPAELKVKYNDQIYNEENGIIFIENAQAGQYQLELKGFSSGEYQLIIWQIGENNDLWETVKNNTNQDQIDNYLINFIPQNPQPIFPSPTSTPTLSPTLTPTLTPTPTITTTITNNSESQQNTQISKSSSEKEQSSNKSETNDKNNSQNLLVKKNNQEINDADQKIDNLLKTGQVLGEKNKGVYKSLFKNKFINFSLIIIFLSLVFYYLKKTKKNQSSSLKKQS